MSVISLPTTFVDNTIPTAAQLNGDFQALVNDYNGNITNANISPSAAIAESKLAFDISTGHSHNGVDSKLITRSVSYGGFISGTPAVANNLANNPRVRATTTATRLSVYAATAPTGSAAICRVYNVTQAEIVATVTLPDGSNSATTTSMTNEDIAAGDVLRYDATQIGSTVAGSNITIQLDGTE
jgi:hypothetical protein